MIAKMAFDFGHRYLVTGYGRNFLIPTYVIQLRTNADELSTKMKAHIQQISRGHAYAKITCIASTK
jgi:hypothetical protein